MTMIMETSFYDYLTCLDCDAHSAFDNVEMCLDMLWQVQDNTSQCCIVQKKIFELHVFTWWRASTLDVIYESNDVSVWFMSRPFSMWLTIPVLIWFMSWFSMWFTIPFSMWLILWRDFRCDLWGGSKLRLVPLIQWPKFQDLTRPSWNVINCDSDMKVVADCDSDSYKVGECGIGSWHCVSETESHWDHSMKALQNAGLLNLSGEQLSLKQTDWVWTEQILVYWRGQKFS